MKADLENKNKNMHWDEQINLEIMRWKLKPWLREGKSTFIPSMVTSHPTKIFGSAEEKKNARSPVCFDPSAVTIPSWRPVRRHLR